MLDQEVMAPKTNKQKILKYNACKSRDAANESNSSYFYFMTSDFLRNYQMEIV